LILDFDTEISGAHAWIVKENNRYFIEDLGSTNGTFLNNNRISARQELKHNDKIRVGKVDITFIDSLQQSVSPAPPSGSLPPGGFTHTFLHTAPAGIKSIPLTQHRLQKSSKDIQTIGRDPQSSIPLDHSQVSWKHAEIRRTPSGYILVDHNSTNGTFHTPADSGMPRRVTGSVQLKANDSIQIGPFKLLFDGSTLAEMNVQGHIRLDTAGLSVIRNNKTILDNVNLSIKPKDFVAIVGSSGAGKSTLLKALCGVNFAEKGIVKINNTDFYRDFDSFRSILGYVPQDDIIHRQLVVEDALRYAAELRLPEDTRSEEIDERIRDTLVKLDMTSHAQKRVEQLSGGQRKRVSIGVEMLTNPSLFFLDEPTSGLDPATEESLMNLMKDRSKKDGKTVILVTHVTKNLDLCDKIVVMGAGGFLTFYGTPDEAMKFFAVKEFTEIYTKIDTPDKARPLRDKYYQSDYYRLHVLTPLREVSLTENQASGEGHNFLPKKNNISFFRQFFTLTRRYMAIKIADIGGSIVKPTVLILLVCIILAIIFGTSGLTPAIDDTVTVDGHVFDLEAKNNFGSAMKLAFFLCCIAIWFGTSSASLEIISELPIYLRESMVSVSKIPYIASKVFVLSLIALLQTVFITFLLLWFAEARSILVMIYFFFAVFLTFFASICLGLFLSTSAGRDPSEVTNLLPIILVIQIIFSGAIVPLNAMDKHFIMEHPAIFRGFSAFVPSRWAFSMIGDALNLEDILSGALDEEDEDKQIFNMSVYGDFKGSFLSFFNMDSDKPSEIKDFEKHWYQPPLALLCLSGLFLFFCFLLLWSKEARY